MAERVGFEPTVPFRVQRFSRPPDSATLAPLRGGEETFQDTSPNRFLDGQDLLDSGLVKTRSIRARRSIS